MPTTVYCTDVLQARGINPKLSLLWAARNINLIEVGGENVILIYTKAIHYVF